MNSDSGWGGSTALFQLWSRLKGQGPAASLVRGASAAFALKVLAALSGFGAHLFLARILGPTEYGTYTLALSWLLVANIVARSGVPNTLVRYTAQYLAQESWGLLNGLLRYSARRVAILSSGIAIAGGAGVACVSIYLEAETAQTLIIAFAVLPLLALVGVPEGVLTAARRPVLAGFPDSVMRPAITALLVAALWAGAGVAPRAPSAMGLSGVAMLSALATGAYFAWRSLPAAALRSVPDTSHMRAWRALAGSLLLITSLGVLQRRMDAILIGGFLGGTQVGFYSVSARYADLLAFGLHAVNALAAPTIASLYAERRYGDLQRVSSIGAGVATAFAVLGGGIMIGWAEDLLAIFGAEFRSGASALRWLCVGQIVNSATGSVALLLTMTGRQAAALRATGFGALSNLILNCALIPAYGISGAAVATSTSVVLTNVLLWLSVTREMKIDSTLVGLLRVRLRGEQGEQRKG